jgi:23S rRNA A2030 N6-methylase RlmJ
VNSCNKYLCLTFNFFLKTRVQEIEALLAQQKIPFEVDQLVNAMKEVNNSGTSAAYPTTGNQQPREQMDYSKEYINRGNERRNKNRSNYNNEISSVFRDQSSGQQQGGGISEQDLPDMSYCNACKRYGPQENSANDIQPGSWQAQELQDVLEGLEEMQARISDILDSRAHE